MFDTHAHLLDEAFDPDREALLSALPAAGLVGVCEAACQERDFARVTALAEERPFVYGALGFHPENLPGPFDRDGAAAMAALNRALDGSERIVAVGEIGLDYHWEGLLSKEEQQRWLIAQLEIARARRLPVLIHDREAHGDTLTALQTVYAGADAPDVPGVLHCYSGSWEMAQDFLKLGFYLGFGGSLTFSGAKRAVRVAENVPLDRFVFETDCPYLCPVPHRGERNDPSMIRFVEARFAQIRQLPTERIAATAEENARRLFGLKRGD